jgi:predicted membrane protein
MPSLTKQHESFCENAGLFGTMISITCLAQHLFFMIPHWITFIMAAVYVLCIAGFVLLMKKSVTAFPILFTSVVLVFLLEAFMLVSLTFSLVLLLLLVYLLVIVILLYTNDIQKRLKEKLVAEKEEAAKWNGII